MITKVVNVDLHLPIYERLTAKQGDNASRFISFHLLDGDIPFDLTGKSVRVYARKPDKTEIFNDLIINDETKGYCTLELTRQCLASAGVVKMELYISESGKMLTSIPFELEVIARINTAKGIVSTNEFSALEIALGSLQDYTNLRNEIFDARGNEKNLKTRLDNIENDYALKSEIGAPTDEQIDNWLTSHPEATTTVRDNSISWNKLTNELKVNLNNLVKSTVFNSDGSIKEVFIDNYYKLTTMNSNKIIEKWYTDTDNLLFTKTTTLNPDGSISEALV